VTCSSCDPHHRTDSSFKSNVWSEGREFLGHGFFGCFPSEGFAGALVHQARHVAQFGLSDIAQVGALTASATILLYRGRALAALGLPDAAIDVFTRAGRRKDRPEGLPHQVRYDSALLYYETGQRPAPAVNSNASMPPTRSSRIFGRD